MFYASEYVSHVVVVLRRVCDVLYIWPLKSSADLLVHEDMTFIQRQPNVFDVGPTLYKCYTKVLCLLQSIEAAPGRMVIGLNIMYTYCINQSIFAFTVSCELQGCPTAQCTETKIKIFFSTLIARKIRIRDIFIAEHFEWLTWKI